MWNGLTMKAEPKAAWVKALRSGEYKQGQNYLALLDEAGKPAEFCCLGVFCQLQNVPFKVSEEENEVGDKPANFLFDADDGLEEHVGLPQIIWFAQFFDWDDVGVAEITSAGQAVSRLSDHLANMNDDGIAFDDIAAFIEANL